MAEVIIILLCVVAFLLYVVNANNNENLALKRRLRERENFSPPSSPLEQVHKIEKVREIVVLKPICVPQPGVTPSVQKSSGSKKFCQVIFKKHSKKRYDYFLGKNNDIKVGDFVEVWATDKYSGKSKWKVVKVVYISKPGEISSYAESTIIKKAAYPKWK